MPTLEERVAALEGMFPIDVKALPVNKLRRRMEVNWQVNASDILEPGSADIGLLRDVNLGSGTVTWPGGGTASDIIAIVHGFAAPPQFFQPVVYSSADIGLHTMVSHGPSDNATWSIQIFTSAATPAITVETPIRWVAIA